MLLGSALVPVCPFGQPVSSKPTILPKPQLPLTAKHATSPVEKEDLAVKSAVTTSVGGIAVKVAQLFQNKTTISEKHIQDMAIKQRQKEMDVLLNRFQQNIEVCADYYYYY